MKKQLLFMAALCAIAFTSNAQTEQGKNLLSGSVGFSSNKTDYNAVANSTDLKSFNIQPQFGHFFAKNLAVGLNVGYTKSKADYKYTTNQSSVDENNSFNAGPFVRYYVDIVEKFKLFGQFNAALAFGKTEQVFSNLADSSPNRSFKYTNYSASINPGFAFFPSKRWEIDFYFQLVSYNKQKFKDQIPANVYPSSYESFNLGFSSFNPNLGFGFLF